MSSLKYVSKLDGLRCVAISLVFVQHFWISPLVFRLEPAPLGVRIFFVLSGYLITRILINYQTDWRTSARDFYWRRFIRLTPALWLAISVAFALGLSDVRENWWIHITYLTNFALAYNDGNMHGGHLWSLAPRSNSTSSGSSSP